MTRASAARRRVLRIGFMLGSLLLPVGALLAVIGGQTRAIALDAVASLVEAVLTGLDCPRG